MQMQTIRICFCGNAPLPSGCAWGRAAPALQERSAGCCLGRRGHQRHKPRRAQAQLRDGDVLARYGGEEFIVLLCGSNQAIARAVAERLRAAMAEPPVQIDGVAVNVRISVGLALRLDADETLARTIERADCNLYRAKREGRNRVVDDSL